MQVDQLHPDADEYSFRRCLEAYLLWLFGWVMFCGTHGHVVDKGIVYYARSIADAEVGEVPQWSWGSALLVAQYRGLCDACTKTDPGVLFSGCPLFISLWVAERFAIAALWWPSDRTSRACTTTVLQTSSPRWGLYGVDMRYVFYHNSFTLPMGYSETC